MYIYFVARLLLVGLGWIGRSIVDCIILFSFSFCLDIIIRFNG